MSITSISSVAPPQPPQISLRSREQDAFRQLEQALQSGDLSGAQQAYNTLAAFGPNTSTPSNSGPFVNPSLAKQFAAVGQALQAGDLATAQQETAQLGTDLLKRDVQRVRHEIQQGGVQNAQKAIADLRGDLWAVTGQASSTSTPSSPTAPGSPTTGTPGVSLQA